MKRHPINKPSKEEMELWEAVKRTAIPLRDEAPSPPSEDAQAIGAPPKKKAISRKIHPFEVGVKAPVRANSHKLTPTIAEQLADTPIQMDRKKYTKMSRGKLAPEARIDLHGMTMNEAHPVLVSFIMSSYARGFRLVLVITGKGKVKDLGGPIPVRTGVLKHQLPHWLSSAPLRSIVLQVSESHKTHGGSGAYYVYLRRKG